MFFLFQLIFLDVNAVSGWIIRLLFHSGGENLFNHKRDFIAQSLLLSPSHPPDMTEILLKRKQITIHPSNYQPIHSAIFHKRNKTLADTCIQESFSIESVSEGFPSYSFSSWSETLIILVTPKTVDKCIMKICICLSSIKPTYTSKKVMCPTKDSENSTGLANVIQTYLLQFRK